MSCIRFRWRRGRGKGKEQSAKFLWPKKIPFEANKDYISVRKGLPIEALFPDPWIKQAYEQHSGWFNNFSVDASDELESFRLTDGSKKSFANYMKEKATSETSIDWAKRWIDVCTSIDSALTDRRNKLEANKGIQPTVLVASAPSTAADG